MNAFRLEPSGAVLKDAANFSPFQFGSVEDVRFANAGSNLASAVFGCVSTCGQLAVVDPRSTQKQQPIQLSKADLNVMDFDYEDENLVYCGDDLGQVFAVDLRSTAQPLTVLHYNQASITSLKACPSSGGTVAVSDDNGAVVIYQMD